MKNIVLYKSRYGNTFQYATWISELLHWEIRDLSEFRKEDIKDYQNIIFGTGVYMGKMNQIKKVLRWFEDKSIIIFACAGNDNVSKEIEVIKKKNFADEQLLFHKFFYMPGGVDFSKVKGPKGRMLDVFRKVMEMKRNKTDEQKAILEGFYHPTNFVDKKHIEPIVNYVKNQLMQ